MIQKMFKYYYVIARRALALRAEAISHAMMEIAYSASTMSGWVSIRRKKQERGYPSTSSGHRSTTSPRNDIRLLLFFLLSSCAPSGGLWGYAPITVAPTSTVMEWPTPLPTLTPAPATETLISTPIIERVLLVTFDGLRPEAINQAPMDNLIYMARGSSYTLNAKTIFPPWTLPAHTSMLDGMCQSKHGVTWNEYIPENGYAVGTDIFDLAHAAGLKTVMVVGKEKLRQVTEPASTDVFIFKDHSIGEDPAIAKSAVQEMKNGFDLMFVHFPNGDIVGHESGWLSKRQLTAYHEEDIAFKTLLDGLVANQLERTTLVIVTSDHGGQGTNHITRQAEDMTIPWIMAGPGIPAKLLTTPVNIMDTAPTIAYALNLPIPLEWDGVVVKEAFGLEPETRKSACQ